MDNQMEDSGHPMTRTPAVMEIRSCPFCGDSMEAALGLIRHIDPTAACPIRQQSWPIETLAAWNNRTPAEPLADGEMIEKLDCVVQMSRQYEAAVQRIPEAARGAGERLEQAKRELLSAYNPNDRLREALEPFAKVAEAFDYWCAEAMPSFSYPVDGTRLELAIEDCPAAIGQLTHADFAKARAVLKALTPPSEPTEK